MTQPWINTNSLSLKLIPVSNKPTIVTDGLHIIKIPKCHVFEIYWATCSKLYNHLKFTNQHIWGDLYDHFMSKITFILIMTTWGPNIQKESDNDLDMD